MGNFKIWTVALLALVVIVLSLAGPCNGTHDSSQTVSIIGSVAFGCNACSEHHPAFSGAHVAVKCQRGNDVSANGAGSMNDDGSFAVHLDKVELGDMCLAEVVMPNNKLCSLAKTSALTSLEKLSVSTPLVCNDTKTTLDQKLLLINFSKLHVKSEFLTVSKFLKPSKSYFFKPKPSPKLPLLPPIWKPKPKFFKPKSLLKPQPKVILVKPKPLPKLPPVPSIMKPKAILKPKFFTHFLPKLKFPPFPKLKFPPFPSPQPLSPIPKLKLPPFPSPSPKLKFPPFPKLKFPPLPKLIFPPFPSPQPLSPIPKLKLPPFPSPSPSPKLPPKPKFSKPPVPKPKLAPPPSEDP